MGRDHSEGDCSDKLPVYELAIGPLRTGESTLVIAYEKFGVLALAVIHEPQN